MRPQFSLGALMIVTAIAGLGCVLWKLAATVPWGSINQDMAWGAALVVCCVAGGIWRAVQ